MKFLLTILTIFVAIVRAGDGNGDGDDKEGEEAE